MWKTLLKTSDWSDVFDLVSPQLFRILPAGKIARQASTLAKNWMSNKRFRNAKEQCQATLGESDLPITIEDKLEKQRALEDEALTGEQLLELYFHQIFHSSTAILDIRFARFWTRDDGRVAWAPRPYFLEWDHEFQDKLRRVYLAFYADDTDAFDQAVSELGLTGMASIFLDQFGGQDPTSVSFRLDDFRDSFKTILSKSEELDTELHPNFIALGIYLACMYEHLEELGGEYNVAVALERASAKHR
ncbi:MAG: hypothetical protein ACQEVA_06085 [Myxococcota bacterium]